MLGFPFHVAVEARPDQRGRLSSQRPPAKAKMNRIPDNLRSEIDFIMPYSEAP